MPRLIAKLPAGSKITTQANKSADAVETVAASDIERVWGVNLQGEAITVVDGALIRCKATSLVPRESGDLFYAFAPTFTSADLLYVRSDNGTDAYLCTFTPSGHVHCSCQARRSCKHQKRAALSADWHAAADTMEALGHSEQEVVGIWLECVEEAAASFTTKRNQRLIVERAMALFILKGAEMEHEAQEIEDASEEFLGDDAREEIEVTKEARQAASDAGLRIPKKKRTQRARTADSVRGRSGSTPESMRGRNLEVTRRVCLRAGAGIRLYLKRRANSETVFGSPVRSRSLPLPDPPGWQIDASQCV